MICDTLFDAAGKIREVLKDPLFENFYTGELRERIEKLATEMDSVSNLPGIDPQPDNETLALRAEAMDQWHREQSCLQEDEEAEIAAEAIKPMKAKPDDREQHEELDEDLWPD
jgi:hypothetical protein